VHAVAGQVAVGGAVGAFGVACAEALCTGAGAALLEERTGLQVARGDAWVDASDYAAEGLLDGIFLRGGENEKGRYGDGEERCEVDHFERD
jgi:hypothetical protein